MEYIMKSQRDWCENSPHVGLQFLLINEQELPYTPSKEVKTRYGSIPNPEYNERMSQLERAYHS